MNKSFFGVAEIAKIKMRLHFPEWPKTRTHSLMN